MGNIYMNCTKFLLQTGHILQPESQNARSVPISAAGAAGCAIAAHAGAGRGQFSQSAKFHAWDMNAQMFTMVLLMLCVLIFLLPLIVLNFLFARQWGELVCFALWPCWSPKWQDNWRWRLVVSKGLEFIWYFCYTTAISIHALYILLNKWWLHNDESQNL